jgi:GTP-binding protein
MFVDEVDIHVAAGHGGAGALSFRREKFVPRGGPDGGDGGHGGSVFLVARANLNTLLNFRFQKSFEAGNGAGGEGSLRTGKSGADITLQVPIGTQVFEKREGEQVLIADLTEEGAPILIAKGGLGGQGTSPDCPARKRICASSSSCWPMSASSGFPTPANPRSSRASRRRSRRSPTTHSRH